MIQVSGAEMTLEELRALPVKEYLYRTVLPALLPGLQAKAGPKTQGNHPEGAYLELR